MTLLELLVKELPKRGGWPEGANFIACDKDGQVDSYKYIPVPDSTGLNWKCSSGEGFLSPSIVPACACSDCDSSIITCEQYEAAIAAQNIEWDGKGLPPVGSKVESIINGEWKLVKVVYTGDPGGKYEALVFDVKTTKPAWSDLFRPLRTEAERKREEAIQAMYEVVSQSGYDTPEPVAIYDAIAAGKIPGVELSK